ncbi:hypothetical protein D1164_14045 [Mariniphaga sediminis]|uniref:Uncharacterized protein n=2 Tax=Mariniphaga sediminis TaxID=1628158 RepID=A0A399CYS2_9BACT|nr:hypothetical protein D1164_14045 [Mariniphaga sediminis]
MFPAKPKTFNADTVYWRGDDLVVGFELESYLAVIEVNVNDDYIGFKLKDLEYEILDYGVKRRTEIDKFTLLQLPVQNRDNFGEWLNVSWDEQVAINLLATDPYAMIDAEERDGFRIFKAELHEEVKMKGVEVVLITTEKENLLNRIEKVENDFNLPKGVASRRSKEYKYSYYEIWDATPQNIDEHIAFAKKGGFKAIQIVWNSFVSSFGHYPWKAEYPNGMKDLQTVVRKVKDAGMIVGTHLWYNKVDKTDLFVSPVPDHRLSLRRNFTLALPLGKDSDIVTVEENPEGVTMEEGRRLLKIGDELIEYAGFTTERPYQFTGCMRGALNTEVSDYVQGYRLGLLDVDTWPKWVRLDQRTSIQDEIAEKIGKIYNDAGFDFIYFDGAEDVIPPYWFYTSLAQNKLYQNFTSPPVFSEGAIKSHFSWHILTRGNAFDTFRPEVIKEATRKYPLAQAKFVSKDFTSINFGWMKYVAPGESTIGMQPDMFEYVCSRGAAWDCPVSLIGELEIFKKHNRTSDNLEVIRRWEKARIENFFTDKQKEELKNSNQEHILLINEDGGFEMLPYTQILNVAEENKNVRAFIFQRNNKTCVVYWHISGEGSLELPVSSESVRLFEELGEEISLPKNEERISIPLGDRRYVQFDISKGEVIDLFSKAKIK